MTDTPGEYEADEPEQGTEWCAECQQHTARVSVSPACPVCDSPTYRDGIAKETKRALSVYVAYEQMRKEGFPNA